MHRGATNEKCTKKIVVTKPEGKRPLGGPRHRGATNEKCTKKL